MTMLFFHRRALYPLAGTIIFSIGVLALAKPAMLQAMGNMVGISFADGDGITVSSVEQLKREIAKAKKHTVFRLKPGEYDGFYLGKVNVPEGIVIESVDPANRAVVPGGVIKGSANITLRNMLFTRSPDAAPQQYLLLVEGSSDIVVENVELLGQGDPAADKRISALMLRGSRNIRVVGSRLSRFRYALSFLGGSNITIERNEFTDLRTDAIRGGGVDDLTVVGNVIGNFQPAEGDHPDGIQLWSNNTSRPARNITIRDNLIVRDGGGIIQGIFIRDTARQLPFENVAISGNLIVGSMYNGICIDGVRGARVSDNVVIPQGSMRSWIRIERGQDVELTDNRAQLYIVGKGAVVKQVRSKRTGPLKDPLASVVRPWLETKPELKAMPGPYLRSLTGMSGTENR